MERVILYRIKDFFQKGNERSVKAKKNIAASLIIKGGSILINLALVPLTINYVNPTQYGIWITLSSIVTWFGFFDIGFGNGLRNKFAEAKANGDFGKVRSYISTTYISLGIIFSFVWLVFFLLNHFLNWNTILNAPIESSGNLALVALIVFSFFCLQVVFKTINTILIADQRPAVSGFTDMVGQLLALLIIVALVKMLPNGNLFYLALAIGFPPVFIMLISTVYFFSKDYHDFVPKLSLFNFAHAKEILHLGLKFFFIQISFIVVFQTSNIIIANVCSPDDVTIYNVAYKYFGISFMVFNIVMTPFWSAYSEAYTKRDYYWMKNTLKALKKIAFYFLGFSFLLFLVSNWAFKLWIGNAVQIKLLLSFFMMLYFMTHIYHALYVQILNGMGRVKLQLYIFLFIAVLNIPLSIFLAKLIGLEGVIIATIINNLIILSYAPRQVNLLIKGKAYGIFKK